MIPAGRGVVATDSGGMADMLDSGRVRKRDPMPERDGETYTPMHGL